MRDAIPPVVRLIAAMRSLEDAERLVRHAAQQLPNRAAIEHTASQIRHQREMVAATVRFMGADPGSEAAGDALAYMEGTARFITPRLCAICGQPTEGARITCLACARAKAAESEAAGDE